MKYTDLCARLSKDVYYGDERLHNLARHNPLHAEAIAAIRELEAEVKAAPNVANLWQDFRQQYEDRIHAEKTRAEAAEARVAELTRERDAVEALVRAGEIRFFQTGQAETPAAPLKMEPWVRLADRGEAARRV